MIDEIDFSTILMVDEMANFSIKIDDKEFVLPEDNGKITIKRELFDSNKDIHKVAIYYNDKSSDSRTLITDEMTIELLPMEIK